MPAWRDVTVLQVHSAALAAAAREAVYDRAIASLDEHGRSRHDPARSEAGLTEHSFSITEKQIWVIKEVKIKEKGNNKKRPSLLKSKNEN